jgi:hypothetical protein
MSKGVVRVVSRLCGKGKQAYMCGRAEILYSARSAERMHDRIGMVPVLSMPSRPR